MSNLSLVEATLPPGFRFHPKDEELICDYLIDKFSFSESRMLVEIDLNKCEPWDLPDTACVGGKEWYFYSQRDRKYATGLRTNRATISGYWKATGKDRSILRNRTLVGMRKTLVFYLGRAPKGKKTDWIMHEFRVQSSLEPAQVDSSVKEDWVLCRVFCKNRETSGDQKQNSNIGSKYESNEDTFSSTSLPPLMDPFTLSFDQTQFMTNLNNNNNSNSNNNNIFNQQQVPCFSNNFNPHIDLINNNHHHFTTIQPPLPLQTSSSSSYCCEKKDTDIKSILNRFNNLHEHDNHFKGSTLSFSEGISEQSFLSDADLPVTMWYP